LLKYVYTEETFAFVKTGCDIKDIVKNILSIKCNVHFFLLILNNFKMGIIVLIESLIEKYISNAVIDKISISFFLINNMLFIELLHYIKFVSLIRMYMLYAWHKRSRCLVGAKYAIFRGNENFVIQKVFLVMCSLKIILQKQNRLHTLYTSIEIAMKFSYGL
jgi:hypothetical protein